MTLLVVWEWVQLLWSVLQSYIALSVSHAYDEYTFQTSKNPRVPNVAEDSLLRYAKIICWKIAEINIKWSFLSKIHLTKKRKRTFQNFQELYILSHDSCKVETTVENEFYDKYSVWEFILIENRLIMPFPILFLLNKLIYMI